MRIFRRKPAVVRSYYPTPHGWVEMTREQWLAHEQERWHEDMLDLIKFHEAKGTDPSTKFAHRIRLSVADYEASVTKT